MHLTPMNMTDTPPVAAGREVLAFGPFQLDLEQRVLREGAAAIRVNPRTLELLIALAERAGEVVTKYELLERGWPGSVIQEGVLRVHISALRKVLGDGVSGTRYVENVSGRGYRFVARVRTQQGVRKLTATPAPAQPAPAGQAWGTHRADNLPALLTRVLGRSDVVSALAGKLKQQRFVSVVGPGGIGKTTIAVALAEHLCEAYADGVRFLDLSLITEGRLVPGALAALLGLPNVLDDPTRRLLAVLGRKSMLIVLDNCEHLTDTIADLSDTVLGGAAGVDLLATSRQPLRTKNEHVFRLAPLKTPPQLEQLTREAALTFPAVQLFVERAMASMDTFELTHIDAPLVAEICRRLDGNPLAIELAAARVDILGLQGLAARLNDSLRILAGGRRTAATRHQSLRATLDWSYNLLCASEQALLRRLAVFNGSFGLESASAVAADETLQTAAVIEHLEGLEAKSLLAADTSGEAVLYRLPQYQREYALGKLGSSGEETEVRRRHVEMWRTSGSARFYSQRRHGAEWLEVYGRKIDDIRAALHWCFAVESNIPFGTTLSLISMWFEFILVSEYDGRLEDALASVISRPFTEEDAPARLEQLLCDVILQARGPVQGLTAAQRLGPAALERRMALWGLWAERLVGRDHRLANAISAYFPIQPAPGGGARLVDRMLMVAHHYAGRQGPARLCAERVLRQTAEASMTPAQHALLSCDPRAVLSRVLWMQGFPDQAMRTAQQSVTEAMMTGNAYLTCYTLVTAFVISIYTGDPEKAGEFVTALRERSAAYSLEYYQVWARCLTQVLAIKSGDLEAPEHFSLTSDPLSGPQYLDDLGTLCESLVSTCAIARAENGRAGWRAAETLRVKGERLLEESGPDSPGQAEAVFQVALQTAREQGALSFELRVAMSLTRLWRSQGRSQAAHDLLSGVYGRFVEGFGTADLRAARALLTELAAGGERL
jgi:predicted ATPase/DNA-binding winged helix-turn-helix (wHTH) protein